MGAGITGSLPRAGPTASWAQTFRTRSGMPCKHTVVAVLYPPSGALAPVCVVVLSPKRRREDHQPPRQAADPTDDRTLIPPRDPPLSPSNTFVSKATDGTRWVARCPAKARWTDCSRSERADPPKEESAHQQAARSRPEVTDCGTLFHPATPVKIHIRPVSLRQCLDYVTEWCVFHVIPLPMANKKVDQICRLHGGPGWGRYPGIGF